jgi:transposase
MAVFDRFDRWSKRGRWDALFAVLQTAIDPEWQSIDRTTNRAHPHAARGKGGPAVHGTADREVVRRPRSTSSSMPSAFHSRSS